MAGNLLDRISRFADKVKPIVDVAHKGAQIAGAVQAYKGMRQQSRMLKQERAVQQEADREARKEEAWAARETRFNMSRFARGGSARGRSYYGTSGGYPTGYSGFY